MVRIDKSSVPIPSILDVGGKGHALTEQMKTDYDNGGRAFKFSSKIYGHKTVKEALKAAQKNKCCFCEAKVSHISHGDVEHFRPKAGFNVEPKIKLTKPGYFWLAYDFYNLYFSCQICNQSFKKNFFPILYEGFRARSHNDDLPLEKNLIIHPEHDNPEFHLTFNREVILARYGSVMGTETIKRTGLDRKELDNNRLEYLKILETLAKVAKGNSPEAPEAKAHFILLGKPESVYSLMVRSNFPDLV